MKTFLPKAHPAFRRNPNVVPVMAIRKFDSSF
jgi:hypothetical protein